MSRFVESPPAKRSMKSRYDRDERATRQRPLEWLLLREEDHRPNTPQIFRGPNYERRYATVDTALGRRFQLYVRFVGEGD